MIPLSSQPDDQRRSEIAKAIEILQTGNAVAAAPAVEILYSRTVYDGAVFGTAPDAVDQILTSLREPGFPNTAMGLRYICDVLGACNAYSYNPNREQYTSAIRTRVDADNAKASGKDYVLPLLFKSSARYP